MIVTTESNAGKSLRKAEARVEAQSAVFAKELGLRDLVLTQIMTVVGSAWVGVAAKLGPSQVAFWLLAILLFYIPQAAVVIHLNRLMPLEGGLYQWAKLGFSEFIGFMVAWNLWVYTILVMSAIGLLTATGLSYATGSQNNWLAGSKWFITAMSCLVMGALVVVSIRGLSVSKWVHNVGGLMLLLAFGALIALPFVSPGRRAVSEFHPLAITFPVVSLLSLNVFGKLAMGALSGFEYIVILAGECRHPERTISRSVILAAPIIALMFILGTSSVLAFVRPEDVDLIGPIPQVLSIGLGSYGFVSFIVPAAILMLLGRVVANTSYLFTGNTRLPMVAGWDRLLPQWFTRLHPKYKTPVNSILFVGAITLTAGLASLIGVKEQEAYQLLDNAAGVFYALTYLVMFAIPLVGLRGLAGQSPWWLKIASISGFLVTLLFTVFSIIPIVKVESRTGFALRIIVVILAANSIGAMLFLIAERKRRGETLNAPAP